MSYRRLIRTKSIHDIAKLFQILTNVKRNPASAARTRHARTQTDLTDATAILASLETDTAAQQVYHAGFYLWRKNFLTASDSLNQAIASEFFKEEKTKKGSSMPCKRILGQNTKLMK